MVTFMIYFKEVTRLFLTCKTPYCRTNNKRSQDVALASQAEAVFELLLLQDGKKILKWRKFPGHQSENTFSNAHNSTKISKIKVTVIMCYMDFFIIFVMT